jgi:hypothetical protein
VFLEIGLKLAGICAAAVLAILLGGCSVSGLTSMFGSSTDEDTWEASVSRENLLAAAKMASDTGVSADSVDTTYGCPKLLVPATGKQLTIYEIGRIGDGLAIIHRGEISKTARECTLGTEGISINYGYAGRVLLGPKGRSGKITLPVILQVKDAKNRNIKTEKMSVTVNIPKDRPYGYFSDVNKVIFKIPSGSQPKNYTMLLSFDISAPGAG